MIGRGRSGVPGGAAGNDPETSRCDRSGTPAPPIRIDDPADPRLTPFRAVRERDLVGRDGVFIAEGLSVLTVLLTASRCETVALLVEETRVPRLPVLDRRGAAPLYVAPQAVLDAVAGFHLHRGILGLGRVPRSATLAVLPGGPLRLPVLVGLANHDNVGGIYRNAAAFGACAVAVDDATADPFYRKAIRVGVGAQLVVPTIRMAALPLIAALTAADVTVYALTPGAGSCLGEVPLAARSAFLLGTEGGGLAPRLLALATPLAIRIAEGFDSLNVAATAAIALNAHAMEYGLG